jgi:hypothetical protein
VSRNIKFYLTDYDLTKGFNPNELTLNKKESNKINYAQVKQLVLK